jgi:hypothetical protein
VSSRSHADLKALAARRNLVAAALFFGAVAVLATQPRLLGHQVADAARGVADARPIWLWSAGFSFLASLLATSFAWRATLALCGGELSHTDAAARYGVGSLVNGLSPARIGEAVRVGLFACALEGEDRGWRMGSAFAVITALRSLVFAVVVIAAAAVGAVPIWPVLVLIAATAVAAAIACAVRNHAPRTHVAHALDAFRGLARSPRNAVGIAARLALATSVRFVGAAAIAAALGVRAPFTAALIIVPTLDVAGLIPLSGNVGITSGAVAIALREHGVALSQALATGLAFHAVETGAGIAFGAAGVLLLAGRRRLIVVAAAGATACIAGAFCATVLVPLA